MDLYSLFDSVKEVRIMMKEGVSRGFGFVTFGSEEAMNKAIEKNGELFQGKELHIERAKHRTY